jgi:hypothetical protein
MTGLEAGQWAIIVSVVALLNWPHVRIVRKAGYSGWWATILLIPLVNIVMIWVFAFADWPQVDKGDGQ